MPGLWRFPRPLRGLASRFGGWRGRLPLNATVSAGRRCRGEPGGYRVSRRAQVASAPSRPRRESIWIHETAFPRSVLVAARRRLDGRTLLAALRTRRVPTGAFFSDRDPLPLLLETAKVANKILQSALITGRRPLSHP